ncbi:MAG: galactose-1-phosphate uridylyltransferase [bacterium]
MPELRKDPIIGRWVIIATERARRPSEFIPPPEEKRTGFCPFCNGNEEKTPPEILAYRQPGTRPNTPGWSVRVVPNKFPALRIEGGLDKRAVGLYDKMNGVGAHEVIIETPHHDLPLPNLPLDNFVQVLQAYQDRVIDLKRDPRFQYVLIFKNQGHAAGASLDHPHSQLIALPVIPKRVVEEIRGTNTYYLYRDRCVICDIIHQELDMEVRLIDQNQHFIALSPFASRFPFETWVIPKAHAVYFEAISPDHLRALGQMLKGVLQRITRTLNNPPYNFLIHSAPFYEKEASFYHWHIEIIPKLTHVAGFEWGTGFYINPTPPEEACRFLREAQI